LLGPEPVLGLVVPDRPAHDLRVEQSVPQGIHADPAARDRTQTRDGDPPPPDGAFRADPDLHQSLAEIRSNACPMVVMSSSSVSSTVMSNASSNAMTSSTRSRLSASR